MGECVDPEGNGVSFGRGQKGGLAHLVRNKKKQLICNSGRDKTPMGNQEDRRQVQYDVKNPSRTEYVIL
jgi:hypothetical protein